MKKKQSLSFVILLIMSAFVLFVGSCSKEDDIVSPVPIPPISTSNELAPPLFNSSITYGTMTDQNGNLYKTVKIGTQTWMAENLRVTKYNDGTAIPNITDDAEWGKLNTGAYCNYDNTVDANFIAAYGRLYNAYAVNTGKLAPKGWHVPTVDDWSQLITYVGGKMSGGGKLKEAGFLHWSKGPWLGGNNDYGFTALPSGNRNAMSMPSFKDIGKYSDWWGTANWACSVTYYDNYTSCWATNNYRIGFPVRCVKD